MLATPQQVHHLTPFGLGIYCHHVQSGRHDLGDVCIPQRHDAGEHVTLIRPERLVARHLWGEQELQAPLQRSDETQQGLERHQAAARHRGCRGRQLRQQHSGPTRQRVGEHVQQRARHCYRQRRLQRRSKPPSHRMGRRHACHHQQGQPAHLDRPVQGHGLARGGWGVAEGAHQGRGLLRKDEKSGPQRGHERNEQRRVRHRRGTHRALPLEISRTYRSWALHMADSVLPLPSGCS